MKLTPNDLEQLRERNVSVERVERQRSQLRDGFPPVVLDRPATLGDGIRVLDSERLDDFTTAFEAARDAGRVMKFVPASGAASRMFASLLSALHDTSRDPREQTDVARFLDHLDAFPFVGELERCLGGSLANADARDILRTLLTEEGLGYAMLPKGLVPFHHAPGGARTAFAEHVEEAAHLTCDRHGHGRLHFTVAGPFRDRIAKHLSAITSRYQPREIEVEFSEQLPETDTVALDASGELARDADGALLFRPGGHGALLVNLDRIQGDIVMIKNIDNVVPDHLKGDTLRYKGLLVGLLSELQSRAHDLLRRLPTEPRAVEEAEAFLSSELNRPVPSLKNADERVARAFSLLDRPLRVCGMVRNEGEPGGGPFWVRHADGKLSLQVVEFAQVDTSQPDQTKAFRGATHFSPVDFICGLRDHRGEPYALAEFVDENSGFVSEKSKDGVALRALELPGLWNGSMAGWNTVLVEVPITTFSPVKTVLDLLRPQHQPE